VAAYTQVISPDASSRYSLGSQPCKSCDHSYCQDLRQIAERTNCEKCWQPIGYDRLYSYSRYSHSYQHFVCNTDDET
jgi:hypothetical protein